MTSPDARLDHFYPRPPRGGRRAPLLTPRDSSRISIHALREEGDLNDFTKRGILIIFLSTPSARRATASANGGAVGTQFLSTPSARRATVRRLRAGRPPRNFYPRPPRGGRHACTGRAVLGLYFYPRPPRGGRLVALTVLRSAPRFLSTPSARRATGSRLDPHPGSVISIHALREEGDSSVRAPRETAERFLSTPSARRATILSAYTLSFVRYFYPRPPRGGRPSRCCCGDVGPYFYPRPPRGGRRLSV